MNNLFIFIDLSRDLDFPNYINNLYTAKNIIDVIKTKYNIKLEPFKAVIFFDEAQNYINILTALKSFKEDGKFDIIVSGSNLGFFMKDVSLLPIGYAEIYEMRSLDFEEFLWALNIPLKFIEIARDKMIKNIKLTNCEIEFFEKAFNLYENIGSLPEVVNTYLNNPDKVIEILKQINLMYQDDMVKYSDYNVKTRIKIIYDHIPVMLAEENKRFVFSKIKKSARYHQFIEAFEHLNHARLINVCHQVSKIAFPLKSFVVSENFKIYHRDQGLLLNMIVPDVSLEELMDFDFGKTKGGLKENIIAEILAKQNFDLYFYKKNANTSEVDFIVQYKSLTIPIEIKANNGNAKSLKYALKDKDNDIKFAIKFRKGNIDYDNDKTYIFPHFLSFLLKDFLEFKLKELKK